VYRVATGPNDVARARSCIRLPLVTLSVLLIATAILVALALLVVALVTARRMLRRYQRERVLDTR
jgi:multisubunit Na+/H+ antiporter MnhC subunit